MDWQTVILIILIIGLLAWSITRRRRPLNDDLGIAISLITEIDYDLKVAEGIRNNYHSARLFRTGVWKRYQSKFGFLETAATSALNETFVLLDDLNVRIQTAKKNKSFSTLQDLPLEKVNELLTKDKELLIGWLRTSDAAKSQDRRRGCLGF